MKRTTLIGLLSGAGIAAGITRAADHRAGSLPVREVTAFKDGHALVLRGGSVPLNEQGDAVIGELPMAILGAFWADESEPNARLSAVTAAVARAPSTRPVGDTADLLRANIGRTVRFRDAFNEVRTGRIAEIIERPTNAEPELAQPYWSGADWVTPPRPERPRPGPVRRVVLLEFNDGVSALPIEEIRDLHFLGGPPARELTEDADTESMTLDLVWDGPTPAEAEVSLMSIQRGLRWIPSYRVTMLDDDTVRIELQATLVNELADLEAVTVHMAVGVPRFAFEHTPDPMSMRESLGDLGLFFRRTPNGQTGGMLSNALMSQSARMSDYRAGFGGSAETAQPASPELTGSERAEDLFVFTVEGVTLARGARMVLPLATYESPAHSVYTLDLPAGPPSPALRHFNNDQQRQLAQLLARPTARHVLRICNENPGRLPITTAPAVVVRDGVTLAQGMLPYAAPGAEVDLEVGTAVDISVELGEVETERVPNAVQWDGTSFARADIAWSATLTNRKPHAVTLEVRKLAFGAPDRANPDGKAEAISMFGDEAFWVGAEDAWWRWYGWPYYWHRLNGAARFAWTVRLDAGQKTTLEAGWHYFWN